MLFDLQMISGGARVFIPRAEHRAQSLFLFHDQIVFGSDYIVSELRSDRE